ncbi:MAG: type II secretion system protein [Planctomycetes bacterium]|nr:type II secretion system protein [Planctomycetota bacterium]
MQNTRYKKRDTPQDTLQWKYETGFTIVELLLALAIAGILLAAVATAFNASIINYRENEDIFKAINSARGALLRITSQLRDANSVNPDSPDNECALETADGDFVTYQYNNVDNKLYLIDSSPGSPYVLCDNVTDMTFTKDTVFIESIEKVRSVQISIRVTRGNAQRKISAAAVIRRNLSW